jgi:mRNA interferase HigB
MGSIAFQIPKVYIDYEDQIVFIRHAIAHAEYDKDDWKNDDWYE